MAEDKLQSVLIGIQAITYYTGISKPTFYELIKHKFPANCIAGTWYAHKENIENYFKSITRTPPSNIPDNLKDV